MDNADRARQLAASPLGWLPGDSLEAGRRSKARRAAANERRFLSPSSGLRDGLASERWQLLVSGQVQGVGYRAACCGRARELGLAGWVRNRSDGTVEVEAEGPIQALAELRLWCERGPAGAQVSRVVVRQIGNTGADWFEIRR